MTRIILNADDFGLANGVNRSILELNRVGALSSATIMSTARRAAAAVRATAAHPALGIGCHLVLVDGTPALSLDSIPALAPSGRFRATLGAFVRDLVRGAIPESEIESEAIAQIRNLQSAGLRLTHLDTHKHTHMFPRVLRPLLRAALACSIPAIRNPFEPNWALRATPGIPLFRRAQVRLLLTQRSEFLRLVQQAGLATTDGAVGVLATGTLDVKTLNFMLAAMPSGTWELVCHPGHLDEDLNSANTRLRESRPIEHAALLQIVPAFLRAHPEAAMIHFGDLTTGGSTGENQLP